MSQNVQNETELQTCRHSFYSVNVHASYELTEVLKNLNTVELTRVLKNLNSLTYWSFEESEHSWTKGTSNITHGSIWIMQESDLQRDGTFRAQIQCLNFFVGWPLPDVQALTIESCEQWKKLHVLYSNLLYNNVLYSNVLYSNVLVLYS